MLLGGCYIQVGRWNSHRVYFYVNFISEVLCRTSSQMCGRWYLPMFLFRDGLLTLMYTGSLPIQTCISNGTAITPISSKYSVVGTLHHRAKTICSSPYMLQKEEEHLSRVLTRCKYPTWEINRVKMKMRTPAQKKKYNNCTNTQKNCQKPYMVVPYYQGLSESVKRTCNKHGVQVYFR